MKNWLCVIFVVFLVSACSDPGETFAYRMDLARQALNEGRYDEAIDRFKNLEKENPYEADIKYAIGVSILFRDVYDDYGNVINKEMSKIPLEYIKKSIDLSPNNNHYGISYAGILSDVGLHSDAVFYFDIFYKNFVMKKKSVQNKNEQAAYIAYANSLFEIGESEKSLSVLNDLESRYSAEELGDPIKEKLSILKERIGSLDANGTPAAP